MPALSVKKQTVPQPEASEIYYDICAAIAQHNHPRLDTLFIEKKLRGQKIDVREYPCLTLPRMIV